MRGTPPYIVSIDNTKSAPGEKIGGDYIVPDLL